MAKPKVKGLPMISSPTRTESTNVETILSRIKNGRIIIPDYQRDAEQWDQRKESLFIESILNNLTIPAFFFSEVEGGKIEVVDGQQRLSTLTKFNNDELTLSSNDEVVYLTPQSVHYEGKTFSELPDFLRDVFNDYPLTIINLPQDIELGTKLEVFRRINEGGTPLTSQDIRLSYYSDSNSVYFIRIAGIHNDSSSAKKMLAVAKSRSIPNLWNDRPDSWAAWLEWWEGKVLAKGQIPSEMFLWYLVSLNRDILDRLITNPNSMRHLSIGYRGTTEEALDIYCAQLQYTDKVGGTSVFSTLGNGLEDQLDAFIIWIGYILNSSLSGISVDKYKQMALLIGALVELDIDQNTVSDDQWDLLSGFIRSPRQAGQKWLKDGYPEQKGRWGGSKGQKSQCDAVHEIVRKVFGKK